MQRLRIPWAQLLVTLVVMGFHIGQAIAADRVALLRHETGDVADRVPHDSTTGTATSGTKTDTALFNVRSRVDSSAITVLANGRKAAASRHTTTSDIFMSIVRPMHVSTLFSLPVELDLFGVAKHRKSHAILFRTRVKKSGFTLTLSYPL